MFYVNCDVVNMQNVFTINHDVHMCSLFESESVSEKFMCVSVRVCTHGCMCVSFSTNVKVLEHQTVGGGESNYGLH